MNIEDEPRTGAERYLSDRLKEPEYRAAYEAAQVVIQPACNRCWDGRHCRGLNKDCGCSACSDPKMKAKVKVKAKAKSKAARKKAPYRDRGYQPRPSKYDYHRPETVPLHGRVRDAVVESIRAGTSIFFVLNHTNFTEGQVRKAMSEEGLCD